MCIYSTDLKREQNVVAMVARKGYKPLSEMSHCFYLIVVWTHEAKCFLVDLCQRQTGANAASSPDFMQYDDILKGAGNENMVHLAYGFTS